jgi:hypothetical protein
MKKKEIVYLVYIVILKNCDSMVLYLNYFERHFCYENKNKFFNRVIAAYFIGDMWMSFTV